MLSYSIISGQGDKEEILKETEEYKGNQDSVLFIELGVKRGGSGWRGLTRGNSYFIQQVDA